jgi:signal transduction histidine kinase
VITLRDNGALTFQLDDDGVGLAPGMHGTGSGVVNMRDRLAEVAGTLTIESTPGRGTRVVGEVPHVHGARAT